MLKNVLNFLFGKAPDIFDSKGQVVHKLPEQKWKDWKERFAKNEEYNWHQHRGEKRGETSRNH